MLMRLARAKADKVNMEETEANKLSPEEAKDDKVTLNKKRDDEVMRTHLFEDGRVGVGGGRGDNRERDLL